MEFYFVEKSYFFFLRSASLNGKDRFFAKKIFFFLRSARLESMGKLLYAHAWC